MCVQMLGCASLAHRRLLIKRGETRLKRLLIFLQRILVVRNLSKALKIGYISFDLSSLVT